MVKGKIKKIIKKSLKDLQREKKFVKFEIPEIELEKPRNKIYGDYASNVAMRICKVLKKDPVKIAAEISSKIKTRKLKLFEKIEVLKPGFINFFLSKDSLYKGLLKILKEKENFGRLKIGKKIKTNVEFISANPTGQLHIGNGRGAFFGDVLSNVLEMAGYEVKREYFVNDAKVNTQIQELGKTALGKGKSYLTPYLKKLISKLKPSLKNIKSETEAGYFLAKNILNDIRKFVEEKLKIKFDYWISEQNLYTGGKVKGIYQYLKSKRLVYEKNKAIWLDLSRFGQKDEVLIRENNFPTYFLSDIAYHKQKIDRGFKKIIDIWGADHQGHIPRMKAAMKILGFKGEFDILISQIVTIKGAKLSKRKGQILPLEWLVNEVGLDAARFFYLAKSLNSQMEFDLKLAKEQSEKNPVYYVQYAHARICSILEKCKNLKIGKITKKDLSLLSHPIEIELIKELIQFPEIIEDCAKDYQLQRIPNYAQKIATIFHKFYQDCRVLNENEKIKKARISLILAVKTVLKNTLSLMGILAPEKM
jgi:arginyl-tRNA synthetase